MTRYVNPTLLQLAALGIEADDYLADGHHLRWTFSSDLGFPRSGFKLVRRPSPLPWDPKRRDVRVRRAHMLGSEIADGEFRDQEGLHATAADGLTPGSTQHAISVGTDTVRLRFTEDESETAASTPACWALVRYRHRKAGSIAASAVFVDGDTVRVQDRGASGRNLADTLGRLVDTFDLDTLRRIRNVEFLPTLTDVHLDTDQLEARIEASTPERESPAARLRGRVSGRRTGPFGSQPQFRRIPNLNLGSVLDRGRFGGRLGGRFGGGLPDTDEWVEGTFLLNGTVIDEVRLTGRLAEVELVEWITVDDYADANGWQPVETFFLPIDGDDVTYPAQPRSGLQVARDRLYRAKPQALGPWANADWPPDPATDTALEADIDRRYLADYDDLADALETLVTTEVTEAKPQRAVRYGGDEPLEATDGTNDDLSGSTVDVPLLDMLQVASLDPGVAHLLGLATTADEPQQAPVDYMVSADWWTLWLWGVLAPEMRDQALERFGENADGENVALPLPGLSQSRTHRIPSSQVGTVVSVATNVQVGAREAVTPPHGVTGHVESRSGVTGTQAVVDLSWDAPDANLFTDDAHVAFAVRRRHGTADESLSSTEPDSGLPLPRLPAAGGVNTFTDREPPLGDSTYRVAGMDIWGRWSDFAETTETVADTVSPPAPTGLRARLLGDQPTWELELSFDWTAGQRTLAPDTARFEIHCQQGKVDRDFTGWNGCETEAGVFSPLSISWPDLQVTSPLAGVTASVEPPSAASDPTRDARLTVTIPAVTRPYDATHRARISTTVVAVDDSDNASNPARRTVAERVDPVEPTPETLTLEPQVATWPDALGTCYWTVSWTPQPPGSRTQVLRSPEARLLAAVDESRATFTSRDTTARVQRLREIAKNPANQHAFSPAHETPYDDGETRHQVALPAEDRGWTVVMVRHTGPTGTRSPWPSDDEAFAVVRTPETARPPTPQLAATTDAAAPGEIHLTVAPDPSGATETVRLYRTPDRDAVEDLRRMRPLTPQAGSETDPLLVQDAVSPDRWFAYRAVAVAESGLRSAPTAPVWVRAGTTQPPAQPDIEAVAQPSANSRERDVSVRVTGYGLALSLQRRPLGTGRWTRTESVSVEDLGPTLVAPNVQRVTVSDRVPVGTAAVRYEYRAVVTDRRGATATSGTFIQP
ncbi:hypothetical protein [Haladaptatus sp. ZSTT2]|uniref:hypothetical protein n=1 Tax=Haladaptatus sp. ZSTT2 TaxID=3120515 RepID=UPI00300EC992